jgi:hypothetical protein
MLVIVKKEEIRPTKAEGKLVVESATEEKILSMLASKNEIDLNEIGNYYIGKPSVRAEVLAQVLSRVVAALTEDNLQQSVRLLLNLVALPQ